jgi:hypothetical protein
MTLLMHHSDATVDHRIASPRLALKRRGWLVAATGSALVCGFVVGHVADVLSRPDASDAALITLLRFMALLKATMAFGALALSCWRLGQSASPRIILSYAVATALMACGPGLIWSMGTVVYGALLFHAGLFPFVILALRDDATWPLPRVAPFAGRRSRREETSRSTTAEAVPR